MRIEIPLYATNARYPDRLAHSLTVAIARIAGRGLDRVPHGVPEVEHLPDPSVPLVTRDDHFSSVDGLTLELW